MPVKGYAYNRAMFLKARKAGLVPLASLPMRDSTRLLVRSAIVPAMKAERIDYLTSEEKHGSQKIVFQGVVRQVAKSLSQRITPEEAAALSELAPLLARHINPRHQPDEILNRDSARYTPRERELAKRISESTLSKIVHELDTLNSEINFDTSDRHIMRKWESPECPDPELDYFFRNLEFRIRHDIFHSLDSFYRMLREARQ